MDRISVNTSAVRAEQPKSFTAGDQAVSACRQVARDVAQRVKLAS